MYDCIVIGCGFCGSVIARELAEKQNKKVLVVEKRAHIAGNMYDAYNKEGILVQLYGPHTFVTDKNELLDYVKRFGRWHEYILSADSYIDGQLIPLPFGFRAAEKFYDPPKARTVIERLKKEFPRKARVPIYMLTSSNDPLVREYGELLCEKDYIPYTAKQWGLSPEQIDPSVIARVKVVLSYDANYMQQKYQVMPDTCFTDVFRNILDHKNITIQLNTDALNYLCLSEGNSTICYQGLKKGIPVVFTGPIDELFHYIYGHLPYRSLKFVSETYEKDYVQATPFIAYPQAEGYIRVTEYKHLTGQKVNGKTTLIAEYPIEYDPNSEDGKIPYYPVITIENLATYAKYRQLADSYSNLYVCGRLGDYRYYNMDQVIERAFEVCNQILYNWKKGTKE
jgi:UDP-galactopyranose mutase